MLSILGTLLPIFGLIFAGFVCRKRHLLGPSAASELNRFVVWLGLPALLFNVLSHSSMSTLAQPKFIAALSIAGAVIFVVVLITQLLQRRHLLGSSIDAICASYPNTAYVGFPLLALVFGPVSLVPTTIAAILTACVLFGLAVIMMEIGMLAQGGQGNSLLGVAKSLSKNPLIISPILGALFSAFGLAMPSSIDSALHLLGDAASLCALVSLGGVLCGKSEGFGHAREGGATHSHQSGCAATAHVGACGAAVEFAIADWRDGSLAVGAAHRDRTIHAGCVLPTRGRRRVTDHSLLDVGLADDVDGSTGSIASSEDVAHGSKRRQGSGIHKILSSGFSRESPKNESFGSLANCGRALESMRARVCQKRNLRRGINGGAHFERWSVGTAT